MARAAKHRNETAPSTSKNVGGRPKRHRTDPGLVQAIETAGSVGALAEIAGVTVGAVSIWARVPQKAIASISDRLHISRHRLRPDLYDPDDHPITK